MLTIVLHLSTEVIQMSAVTSITVRMEPDLKKEAEKICEEMGITISAAIMMFTKRLVRDRAIPFKVTAESHFCSENNMRHLRAAAERMDAGQFEVHDIGE